jgi:hypothetical protein
VFYHKDSIPNPIKGGYYWNNPIHSILYSLQYKFVFEEKTDFLIEACSTLFANLPEDIINYKGKDNKDYYYQNNRGNGWQELGFFDVFLRGNPFKETYR